MKLRYQYIPVLFALALLSQRAVSGELTADLSGESRAFVSNPAYSGPGRLAGSFSAEAEYYHVWNKRGVQFALTPFVRVDFEDEERTHFDIRELYWQKRFAAWEISAGVRKVYWGVTESVHLVDVINQTDQVENIDGEDKLGQPMVQATWISKWGTFDAFWLPYFRERTFAGSDGRLRPSISINTDISQFESNAREWRQDFAVRWFHTVGQADIGLTYFRGTSREPIFEPNIDRNSEVELIPRYVKTARFGLDLLYITGGWIWKLETVSQEVLTKRNTAFVGGFEYTFVGIWGSRYDLGILAEYIYDDRTFGSTAFEHDLFLGGRLALNDVGNVSVLSGLIIDTEHGSTVALVETSKRLTDWWSLEVELRSFFDQEPGEPLYDLRDDDYLQVSLTRHL